MRNIYIVHLCYDSYDICEIGYHLTRKGALKNMMQRKYQDWTLCRYIQPGSWDDHHMYITERDLED